MMIMPGKYFKLFILFSFALLPFLLFAGSQAVASTSVSGTIATDTIWTVANSPYIVTSNIAVLGTDGADSITTLTIEPGVEVRFNQSTSLTVGASSGSPGALVAQGMAGSPILFTSNKTTPASGDWYGITFQNTADDASSILEYCTIDYAGASSGAIYLNSASPRIFNSIINNSKSYGAYASNSSPQIAGSIISNSYTYGLYFSGGAPVITGNTFVNSGSYDIYFANPTGGSITG
ncbi:MAG: right-handed parallel beta-helix repeat-containing protein, partial [Deltaproteobacteria bacterium]|nr:right-handed parallel beta-helix repeat-containing protein [Deltaproteobacteria bacterium]